MNAGTRTLLVVLGLAALAAATGLVMVRNRKMSLFLEARDRLERGEEPGAVLGELAARIDWAPADDAFARVVAREAVPDRAAAGPVTLHRAGPWGLLTIGENRRFLVEELRTGWSARGP